MNGDSASNGEPPRSTTRSQWRVARVVADATVWAGGLYLAGRVLSGGQGLPAAPWKLGVAYGLTCAVAALAAGWRGLYSGRFPCGSAAELNAVLASAAITGFLLMTVVALPCVGGEPTAVAITTMVSALGMITERAVIAAGRRRLRRPPPSAAKVIVFGAGSAGTQLVQQLIDHRGAPYRPVALLDDDPAKRRLRICGVPVRGGRERIAQVAAETGATVLVIAIARGRRDGRLFKELVTASEAAGLISKVIPPIDELLAGSACIDGVRDPRLSQLLGREQISLDLASVAEQFTGRRILVTGAGGSIGSELCRQLHRMKPASLVMLDRDESALHAVQLALHGRALLDSDETVLADIRDAPRMQEVFALAQPEIVFHAAAVKHLPLLERYPAEALKTNVLGTLNVLEAAAAHGVQSFVNISTDKAADPVSVLGTSKRLTERLTAHMAHLARGNWVSVRFGNVLGSRGSLLSSLSAQIAFGGPVTVTHPEVARYFMTATEAVQLVLQAVDVGRSGEVLVLDMGEQVRIADLARRMTQAASSTAEIVFTGLRPGEKLTEDLLGPGEADHRPRHPLVRQVPVPPLEPSEVTRLSALADPDEVRAALATTVVTGVIPAPHPAPSPHCTLSSGPAAGTGTTDSGTRALSPRSQAAR